MTRGTSRSRIAGVSMKDLSGSKIWRVMLAVMWGTLEAVLMMSTIGIVTRSCWLDIWLANIARLFHLFFLFITVSKST
jgi:hypothetical protein